MNLVIVGAQWGDEGKGKMVDFLADRADFVLRYSGGANAGHTVVIEDSTYKFHLIPSGVVHPNKTVILGIGMVIDLENLFQELKVLDDANIPWKGRMLIADRAHIVLPSYKELDKKMDQERAKPLGTTGRGIGVAYAYKAHRDGIRLVDIFDQQCWSELPENDRNFLEPYKKRVEPMMVDVSDLLNSQKSKNILFEGAQGTLLDLDWGTYPFVSSGSSSVAGAAIGGGVGPTRINRALGVFKAYTSRVGSGPFPSEFKEERDGNLEETIRDLGREYGVTTGRPRRCGYLDLVALRYSCRVNGLDGLVLTHLDVYDQMPEIKVCVAYEIDGQQVDQFPASIEKLNGAKPVLTSYPGWNRSIKECQTYDELPEQAKTYIAAIEAFTDTPVDIVSVGYKRKETIVRRDPWTPS